ncbi:outer membrane beta-barrel protein [Zymomonas sp.]|uniref:outer membrane protein n=1 Tax=Zymomonas sp. TaxID=2068624 RepID=UPI0025D12AAB|nr:outer membrane beta-barrel protein [Zymomonas sp.]MCA1956598.1 outer membrane beta-barrel protein [Zymomonas sp.]
MRKLYLAATALTTAVASQAWAQDTVPQPATPSYGAPAVSDTSASDGSAPVQDAPVVAQDTVAQPAVQPVPLTPDPNEVANHSGIKFRGLRVEGDIGWTRAQANHTSGRNNMGYGGTLGVDAVVDNFFVFGVEGSYWNPSKMWEDNSGSNVAIGSKGNNIGQIGTNQYSARKMFQEWDATLRMGFLPTKDLLIYMAGGYASGKQRNVSVDGAGVALNKKYVGWSNGYSVGGGIEYSITKNFFMNAQYRWTQFGNHTSRSRATLGFGFRFP